jgi:hypothetical protein
VQPRARDRSKNIFFAMKRWFIEFRCWFLFRHRMKELGRVSGSMLWQCGICAKTISVKQSDMSWN